MRRGRRPIGGRGICAAYLLEVGDSTDNKSESIRFKRISIRFYSIHGCGVVARGQLMVIGGSCEP